MVNILDCTLRDGGHQCGWNFDDYFVRKTISNARAQYFEIGYRNFYDADNKGQFYRCTPELIRKFRNNDMKFGVMADISRFNEIDFPSAQKDCIDFVRIATHPDKIFDTFKTAKVLYERGYCVFVQLMEIPNLKEQHYKVLQNWQHKNILESLYIADSYSMVEPCDIEVYFSCLRAMGYNKISFHSHNGKGLALENTKRALELGAFSVDVSQNGLGGNLDCNLLI